MTREEKQKAINALKKSTPIMAMTQERLNDYIQTLNKTMAWLEQEPRKGHWIDTNYHQYYNDGYIETTELRCSCCNEEVEWDIELLHKPYYCENCGADMREIEK